MNSVSWTFTKESSFWNLYRFLPPERHILEGLVVFAIASLMMQYCLIRNIPDRFQSNVGITKLRPPAFLRASTLICFMLQCAYKFNGYPNKFLSMLLPCNVLWIMAMVLSYSEVSPIVTHTIIQLLITYVGLPILALIHPDTSDCVLFGEKLFFFVHHGLLVAYPLYYISVGYRLGGFTEQIRWILLGSAYFAVFYVCFVTPICVITGLNLNYMLHPSLDLVDGGMSGQWFRWLSLRNLVVLFSAMRAILSIFVETSFVLSRRLTKCNV